VDDPKNPDKDELIPGRVTGHPGDVVDIGFYYRAKEDNVTDPFSQNDRIQGVSIAACFDPIFMKVLEPLSYSIEGTATQAAKAEFVNVHYDNVTNEPVDADGASIVIGILVDALPPFDAHTLPPSNYWSQLICVKFVIPDDAPCDVCRPILLCAANGASKVTVRNLVSIKNHSYEPTLVDGEICIVAEPKFIRGDCNFRAKDDKPSTDGWNSVDIADAAAVLAFLFGTDWDWFDPPCLDACDANDDGRIDLADAVYILRYLFKVPSVEPLAPFPLPGTDPSLDHLTCIEGEVCQ